MNITTLLKQTFFLITFLIVSWVLIHALAVFGFFLALALPLLHLAFYPHILCFWCKLRGGTHTFKHSLVDSLLIIVLTSLALPIVYLESRLLLYALGKTPEIASVAEFTIPTRATKQLGEVFALPLELTNIPAAINVVQADISFDPSFVEVIDINVDNTFTKFLVQKEFDNQKGYARLTGGLPNPGYSGKTGLIGTIYFKTKAVGATELSYLDSSLVLANNGRGTNLLSDFPRVPLIITPAGSDETVGTLLQIRNQVQGDTDKTVLSFTEYSHQLPQPYGGVEGVATSIEIPAGEAPSNPYLTKLLQLDAKILGFWRSLVSKQ